MRGEEAVGGINFVVVVDDGKIDEGEEKGVAEEEKEDRETRDGVVEEEEGVEREGCKHET